MSHPKKTNLSNLDLRQEISGEASRKRAIKALSKINESETKQVQLKDYFILPNLNLNYSLIVSSDMKKDDIIKRFKNNPITNDLKLKR